MNFEDFTSLILPNSLWENVLFISIIDMGMLLDCILWILLFLISFDLKFERINIYLMTKTNELTKVLLFGLLHLRTASSGIFQSLAPHPYNKRVSISKYNKNTISQSSGQKLEKHWWFIKKLSHLSTWSPRIDLGNNEVPGGGEVPAPVRLPPLSHQLTARLRWTGTLLLNILKCIRITYTILVW